MKKGLSLFLTLALCLCLATPAFAAGEGSLTRGELAALLVELCGFTDELEDYTGQPSSFSDVQEGTPYAAAVELLQDKGILHGAGAGVFLPQREATLEEAAAALLRWAGLTDDQIGTWPDDYNALADSLLLNTEGVATRSAVTAMAETAGQ